MSWVGEAFFEVVEGAVELFGRVKFGRDARPAATRERAKLLRRRATERANKRKNR